jgi:phosphoenolpyruvate synthase/pyruvate phosphate dikinase
MVKKEYKSPEYKLLNFFESSRDTWKNKALERQNINRDLEARVRDLEKSRNIWKMKAKNIQVSVPDELLKTEIELEKAYQKIKDLEEENTELKKNFLLH